MFIKTEASFSYSRRRTMMMNDNVQKLQELKIIPRSETSQRSAPSVVKKAAFFFFFLQTGH